MKPLDCAEVPCGSCPYRRDTPPGVWDETEYQKLRGYTEGRDGEIALTVFLCHQTNATGRETVCRGWLSVERDSIAVRVALIQGQVTPEQLDAPVRVPLYTTGIEAAEAGLAKIESPPPAAQRMMRKLLRKGAAKWR